MSRTAGGATTSYAYDTNGSLPVLLFDGSRTYVYGPQGLAYSVDTANTVAVYHTDGLGSVRALTNGSGALVQTYQTDAFGVPTASQGTSTQPFGFTGQQVDGNGLLYLRARSYDPATGRFLSRDTYPGDGSNPMSLNRYTYAENNPGLDTDPSGECPMCAAAAAAVGACIESTACLAAVAGAASLATVIVHHYQEHPPSLPQISAPSLPLAGPGSPNPTPVPSRSPGPGWLEGEKGYLVTDPVTRDAITDIDSIEGNILWEEKSATWAGNPTRWAQKQITDKLEAYLRARANLPYYENADIGVRFDGPPTDPAFRDAVEQAIDQERAAHPDVTIHLDWGG